MLTLVRVPLLLRPRRSEIAWVGLQCSRAFLQATTTLFGVMELSISNPEVWGGTYFPQAGEMLYVSKEVRHTTQLIGRPSYQIYDSCDCSATAECCQQPRRLPTAEAFSGP